MANAARHIVGKVQDLSDIELAVLLSLVSDQHCIIQTEETLLNAVENELQFVCMS